MKDISDEALGNHELAAEKVLANVTPISRQVQRAEERKLAKDVESGVRLHEEAVRGLRKAQHMLAALVKMQGRIRLTRAQLQAVGPKDGLDVKVDEQGNLVVTYLERGS